MTGVQTCALPILQVAAFEKNRRADAWTVMQTESLDVKYPAGHLLLRIHLLVQPIGNQRDQFRAVSIMAAMFSAGVS